MSPRPLAELEVLVVDDEADLRLGLRRLLGTLGIEAREAADGRQALRRLEERAADLVVTDLMMPGMSGIDLLEEVKRRAPGTIVIVLTGFGTVQTAVQCLQAGAAHFLIKPFDNDEVLGLVRRLGGQVLARRDAAAGGRPTEIVAEDPRMRGVLDLVARVAPSPVPILVEGESGTGKELVARAIHEQSAVAERPFEAVNCAALPDTLLESELFGHTRGAFTGADRERAGLFEQAAGGTVFLDEIASMSPSFQGKLLRVLQEKVVRPVGGSADRPVAFRLVAATNRDLSEMVSGGTFREDLYYRLAVVAVRIPPLRERPGDIVPLARHVLARAVADCLGEGEVAPALSDEAVAALVAHDWPGNVRELENAIQRAVIVCCGDRILPFHLGLDEAAAGRPGRLEDRREAGAGPAADSPAGEAWVPPDRPAAGEGEDPAFGLGGGAPEGGAGDSLDYAGAKRRALERFQREFVQRALERTGGNVSRAADSCGMTRAALQKILQKLDIDRTAFEHMSR